MISKHLALRIFAQILTNYNGNAVCLFSFIKNNIYIHSIYIFILINQVVARTLKSFGCRCRMISVKLLVFGVKMLPQKMHFLLLNFILTTNAQFKSTNYYK